MSRHGGIVIDIAANHVRRVPSPSQLHRCRYNAFMPARRLLIMLALLTATGCVERTISITSEPDGALVYLNDEEVGRTPVTVPFTYYGTYDVRLEHEGYQPLWTQQRAKAPWWEAPGPDLLAEVRPHNKTEQVWHFTMEPEAPADHDALVDRARQLRASLSDQPQPTPTTQPADR